MKLALIMLISFRQHRIGVPTIFIENHNIVGYEKEDPIEVNYIEKVGKEPTGKENPELLKLQSSARSWA